VTLSAISLLNWLQRFETFGFFEWNAAAISADVEKRRKSARTRIFPGAAAASHYHQSRAARILFEVYCDDNLVHNGNNFWQFLSSISNVETTINS
jgi:hypothetical protein